MRGCQSTGCSNDVAFKTPDSGRNRDPRDSRERLSYPGGRVESRFCINHTCMVFFRAEGCNYKKPDYDSVCMLHTQCVIPNCTQGKVQYLAQNEDLDEPARYARLEVCPEHKCSFPQCGNIRAPVRGGPPGQFQLHCENHRCHIDGCKNPKIEGRPYCPEHKCRLPNCALIVAEGARLCAAHIKCEFKHCNGPKEQIANTKDYHPYCHTHVTCETANCKALRIQDSCHCAKHTCLERGCDSSSGKNRFCEAHRCMAKGCDHPRAWYDRKIRLKLCGLHTCRVYDCEEAVDDEELYCTSHCCSVSSCKSEGVVEGKCGDHFKLQVESAIKSKMKSQTDDLTRQIRERDDMIRDLQEQKIKVMEVRNHWPSSPGI